MSEPNEQPPNLSKNVSTLERDVLHLQRVFEEDRKDRKEWQQSIEQQITTMSRNLSTQIQDITNRTLNESKTPWGILAGWATVLLVIGSMSLSPILDKISIINSDINLLRNRTTTSEINHTAALSKITNLEKNIGNFDEALQKEMRILDEGNLKEASRLLEVINGDLKTIRADVTKNEQLSLERSNYLKDRLDFNRNLSHELRMRTD